MCLSSLSRQVSRRQTAAVCDKTGVSVRCEDGEQIGEKNKPARSHSRCVRAPSGVSVLQASPQPVWNSGAWVFGDSGSIWTAHPLGRACGCEAEEVAVVTTRCPSSAGRRWGSLESLMLAYTVDLDFWLPRVWYRVDSGTGPVGHAGAMRQLRGLGLGSARCFISPDAVHIREAW